MTCTHKSIQTWRLEDDTPAGFWSCSSCRAKFVPLSGMLADIETLEHENRLIRARNERLEAIAGQIVARLEQGFGASHAAPQLIRKEFMDAALGDKR